jgi:hypothetical protein
MAMESKKDSKTEGPDSKERFRYIGFEVFPKEEKPFFASREEEKTYRERVRAASMEEMAERQFTLLFVPAFSRLDKIVLLLCGMLMVGGLFLPWAYVSVGGRWQTYFGFQLFGLLGPLVGPSFEVGWNAGSSALLLLLNLTLAPAFGLWLLLLLLTKKFDTAEKQKSLKKILRLHALPLLAWLAILVFTAIGFAVPASPLPILREGFNIFDLISSSGPGFWTVAVAHLLAAVKSADL